MIRRISRDGVLGCCRNGVLASQAACVCAAEMGLLLVMPVSAGWWLKQAETGRVSFEGVRGSSEGDLGLVVFFLAMECLSIMVKFKGV